MIVFQQGKHFHIETHLVTVETDDATIITSALTNLDIPGNVVGYFSTAGFAPANDNTQANGLITILDQGNGTIFLGEAITGFVVRLHKQAGVSGTSNMNVIVAFMIRG